MDKYRLIQCSSHGTASTLLVNIVTGLFFDNEPIHFITLSKKYSVKISNFITKTHKIDVKSWKKKSTK